MNRPIVCGVLAHVDAGKTTLCESLLFKTGVIKSPGRVDNKDAFLDTKSIERKRGITVFAKQAILPIGDKKVFLQDTPGHADFSSEMERTLTILDYAILVISAPDGIQAHTELLLELLKKHSIPTFVFVNKTDLNFTPLKFPENFIDLSSCDKEELALLSSDALLEYEKTGSVSEKTLANLVAQRKLIPVYYGSALKQVGIDELINGISRFAIAKDYPGDFKAQCFKITRSLDGQRLTWLKVLGGSLKNRTLLGEEKLTAIRIYSGEKFESVEEVFAGSICAIVGLENTYAGQGFGVLDLENSTLRPVLSYMVCPTDGTDRQTAFKYLKELGEEDPSLNVHMDDNGNLCVMLMGEIQTQVLKNTIEERFAMQVEIDEGQVVYKETIASSAIGIGHFEPLRHYAEVHLLLEPLEEGSGIIIETICSEDLLDRNWQRLIMYNLAEYKHRGVLIGAELTDVKITLIAGKSHLKHTEGGDFRQAALRAVRMALMSTENILLEPFFKFSIKISAELIGRVVSDLKAMGAQIDPPESDGIFTVLTGVGPAAKLSPYQKDLMALSKGRAVFSLRYYGYYPCKDASKIVEANGYDPDKDTENQSSSVFCSHGSGSYVPWNHVMEFAHLESGIVIEDGIPCAKSAPKAAFRNTDFDDRQLEEIIRHEMGTPKKASLSNVVYGKKPSSSPFANAKKEYLIVDGYNIVYASGSLNELAKTNMDSAREALIEILAEYSVSSGTETMLVFDGYKRKDNPGSKEDYNLLKVVYTKEAESADAYIEKLAQKMKGNYNVSVASSDALIQLAALRGGIRRVSARELLFLVQTEKERVLSLLSYNAKNKNKLGEVARIVENPKEK